jgi:hypothetical protein
MTTLLATGCVLEDLGGGLDIVNETDQRLYIIDTPIAPDGGRWRFEISDCSNGDLTLRNKDGTVVAELTEEWCPGQTWTITGRGESALKDR